MPFSPNLKCKPPERFREAGHVTWAELANDSPSFTKGTPRRPGRGRRGDGVRYERKVQWAFITTADSGLYLPGPWFRFTAKGESRPRWCQPDGLLFDFERGRITLVEIKHSHTADAWWWVQYLYLPVVRKVFPATLWHYCRCEVVKWYDPAVAFPEPVKLVSHIDRLEESDFGVHIVKP